MRAGGLDEACRRLIGPHSTLAAIAASAPASDRGSKAPPPAGHTQLTLISGRENLGAKSVPSRAGQGDHNRVTAALDSESVLGDGVSRTYWITSVACNSTCGGMVRPSAWAVRRLMMKSNVVGCSIGRSAGVLPLRMRST